MGIKTTNYRIRQETLHIPVTGLCTFDKLNLMKTMMGSTQATFHFGETLNPNNHHNYDLIVDATGYRAMLGRLGNRQVIFNVPD